MVDYAPGEREFQADFETGNEVLDGSSTSLRPDAVTFDHLTSFCMGPVAIGDVSEGINAYVWRARVDNAAGKVWIARENDAGTGFNSETELFSFSGDPIVESDLAFEQAGRGVLCAERADEIWVYWFKPAIADFIFENLGTGRTPKVVMDNPADTTDSDVLLFYLASGGLKCRQQRDNYAVVIDTIITDDTDLYLEEVGRSTDNRVVCLLSDRNTTTGRFSKVRIETTLYPYISPAEPFQLQQSIQSGILLELIIEGLVDEEEFEIQQQIQSGVLDEPLITHELFDVEEFEIQQQIQSGTLPVVVIVHTLFDVEEFEIQQQIQSGELEAILITHELFDVEEFEIQQQIQSGSLIVP